MKDNKKITLLILVLVLTITVILGGTFAYWQWMTITEQETLFNVSLTDDATIYIDFLDNEITNMYPTSDCEANGTSSWVTDITVNNGTGVLLATKFKLKIKIEDKNGNPITNATNEWNDHDLKYYVKYAVTEENESCKNALYTGRFDSNVLTYENVASTDPHYGEKDRWYDSGLITIDGADGFPIVSSRIDSGVSFHALSNRETNPSSVTVNSRYEGRKVTEKFTGFEDSRNVPWHDLVICEFCNFDDDYYSVEKIIFEDYIYPTTSTRDWFALAYDAYYFDVSKLDISKVTDMGNIFGEFF